MTDAEALRRVFAEAAGLDPRVMTAGHDAGLRAVYVEARKAAAREYLDRHGPGIDELTNQLKAAEAEAFAAHQAGEAIDVRRQSAGAFARMWKAAANRYRRLDRCALGSLAFAREALRRLHDAAEAALMARGGPGEDEAAADLRTALAQAYPLTREAKP